MTEASSGAVGRDTGSSPSFSPAPVGQVVIRREEGSFHGASGQPMFRRSWCHPEPDRAMLVVHGLAEHSARYEGLGSWFARRGFAVHAYDQRGHGHSSGTRGFVSHFDEYLDDLACMLELVAEGRPGLPVTLLGHSMGGLVAVSAARERHPPIANLVTSGALLQLPPDVPWWKMIGAQLLHHLSPRLALDSEIDASSLSRDTDVVQRYVDDPLIFTKITASLGYALMLASRRAAEGGAAIEVPMLLLHGAQDRLCPPAGSEQFFASLDEAVAPRSECHLLPGLRHEIFNEPEQQDVFARVLHWLDARRADGGPA